MEKIERKEIKQKWNWNSVVLEELLGTLKLYNIELIKNGLKETEELIQKIKTNIENWKIIFDNKKDYNDNIFLLETIKKRNNNYKQIKNMEENETGVILKEIDFVNSILKSELNVEKWNFKYLFLITNYYEILDL